MSGGEHEERAWKAREKRVESAKEACEARRVQVEERERNIATPTLPYCLTCLSCTLYARLARAFTPEKRRTDNFCPACYSYREDTLIQDEVTLSYTRVISS